MEPDSDSRLQNASRKQCAEGSQSRAKSARAAHSRCTCRPIRTPKMKLRYLFRNLQRPTLMNENVLVVEDEQALRTALEVRLRAEGYVVDTAADGEEGLQKATNLPFDLIILDVMLPYRNGLDVCRAVRQLGLATPILILTVRDQVVDKVVGLNLGADDYMTKPFEAAELIARIQALLRRLPIRTGRGIHQFGPISVDVRRAEVTRDGKQIYLTSREFQ